MHPLLIYTRIKGSMFNNDPILIQRLIKTDVG